MRLTIREYTIDPAKVRTLRKVRIVLNGGGWASVRDFQRKRLAAYRGNPNETAVAIPNGIRITATRPVWELTVERELTLA